MTTITLPRAVVQQALDDLKDLHANHNITYAGTISRLEAALAQEQAEPVAWYFEARHIDSAWAAAVTLKHPGPEGKYMRKVTPLYAAPPRCPNCASLEAQNTELDRKLAEIEASKGAPAALMTTWVSETEAVTEPLYKAPRRLTDAEIGEVWFAARIPGLTESNARRLIRAVEARSGAR